MIGLMESETDAAFEDGDAAVNAGFFLGELLLDADHESIEGFVGGIAGGDEALLLFPEVAADLAAAFFHFADLGFALLVLGGFW